MKITKKTIEAIANKIWAELEKRHAEEDVCVYYNNKRIHKKNGKKVVETDINPHDYFSYAAEKHILSMSFEGSLYEEINYGNGAKWLNNILDKYGLYYELGNSWNLTVYADSDEEYANIEYTDYADEKEEIIDLSSISTCDIPELKNTMIAWQRLSETVGDIGSCVIGAGYKFSYKGKKYFMSAQSPYQGSISWEKHKDIIKLMLENIRAEEIEYDWGIMD